MYLAKMIEDGCKLFTKLFITIDGARAEGKRIWQTTKFDVVEIVDSGVKDGVYEAIRYVPSNVSEW